MRLGRKFHDPTSGMAAVNAKAMPVLAVPYASGAPEVEGLLRLKRDGFRVEEVAVHMRERASGESKLQGKKAVKLVLTVVGTLLFFRWLRNRSLVSDPAPRVIVVLGYSDGGRDEIHPICAARVARAAEHQHRRRRRRPLRLGSRAGDDVRGAADGARVDGRAAEIVVDPDARTTMGNADNAMNDIRRVGAREVVVVTSRWHARRARAAFRLLLWRSAGARHGGVPAGAAEPPARRCASCRSGLSSRHSSGTRQAAAALATARRGSGRRLGLRHLDVDPLLRVAQRAAAAAGADCEDLGQDRERRLLLRVGADVEAARAHDPRELLLRHAGLEQPPRRRVVVRREPSAPT